MWHRSHGSPAPVLLVTDACPSPGATHQGQPSASHSLLVPEKIQDHLYQADGTFTLRQSREAARGRNLTHLTQVISK